MKSLTTVVTVLVSVSLYAGSSPSSPPPAKESAEICDKSPNCKVCAKNKEAVAMEGDRYDNRLSNEANRAAENGNTEREQDLLNREQAAEQRQDGREDAESARTHGRR